MTYAYYFRQSVYPCTYNESLLYIQFNSIEKKKKEQMCTKLNKNVLYLLINF